MSLAHKYRLQDILFSGLNNKQCMQAFGPIIANTIANFKLMEKCIQHSHNWHTHTPIWYNNDIRSGGAPFFSRDWMQKGIYTLKDISGSNCMLSFKNCVSGMDLNPPLCSYICV
ncbi:tRNA dimethylallyltransferase [Labeo rohita]|uniref:tRNA dimethylallyltransferase n=1 Tax=Labeo rohita TaxID=84645 RepID=A0ABQ8LUU5_LABRO|nr:tRNA dimethylallyltransferase [Labeo rohita]